MAAGEKHEYILSSGLVFRQPASVPPVQIRNIHFVEPHFLPSTVGGVHDEI